VSALAAAHVAYTDPTAPRPADPVGADLCAAGKILRFADGPALPLPATEGAGAPASQTDVLHNDLSVTVDPAAGSLTGANTMTIRSLADGLTEVGVRISDQFSLPQVLVDGAAAPWTRLSPTTIRVTLPTPMNTGDVFSLTVAYSGPGVAAGFGSITFGTHAGTPIFSTLSETWYAYTWWPHKDDGQNDNRDKATADIRVTAPDWMTIASNGVLQSETPLAGGLKETHWAATSPMTTYLLSMAGTNYTRFGAVWSHAGGSMPLDFLIYPENDTPTNRNALLQIIPMLDVFSALYGPYPFLNEKYGVYQFNFPGGMEHQTMSGQGSFGQSLSAHELAHQWWGDEVTCADWSNIWLNEGFATYSEALWQEFRPGGSVAGLHAAMAARRPTVFLSSTFIPNPVNPNRIFNTHYTYRKGAWILHMLRHAIGDQAFFDSLAAYRAAHAGGGATTDDLRAAVESVVGEPMDWFFQEWVFEPGAPWYEHAAIERVVGGQRYAEVMIRQASPPTYPIYTMPIDLGVTTDAGLSTVIVRNDAAAEHFLIPLDGPLQSVELDPDSWILTEDVTAVAFAEGPPKIVAVTPAPGSTAPVIDDVTITFQAPVTISQADVTLTGPGGAAAFSFVYDDAAQTATITPAGTLTPGQWTVTLADTVVSAISGLALDGETNAAPPAGPMGGDGEPGGAAVFTFTVARPADLNGDGVVNGADISFILSAWGPCPIPGPCPEDLNGDGAVNGADITFVLSDWG